MKSQRGFALLEILIAVIVILGLTLWWVKTQAHNNDRQTAARMSEQINQVMNAAVNYYEDHADYDDYHDKWPLDPSVTVQKLIDAHYLTQANLQNSFGEPYELFPSKDPSQRVEVLITKVPANKAYLANKAIAPIAQAIVDATPDDQGMISVRVELPPPAVFGTGDAEAVKYMTATSAQSFIPYHVVQCPSAPPGANYHYQKQIFTAIQACTGRNHLPVEACESYADVAPDPSNPGAGDAGWIVHLNMLTEEGWHTDADTGNQIQVSVKCSRVPN